MQTWHTLLTGLIIFIIFFLKDQIRPITDRSFFLVHSLWVFCIQTFIHLLKRSMLCNNFLCNIIMIFFSNVSMYRGSYRTVASREIRVDGSWIYSSIQAKTCTVIAHKKLCTVLDLSTYFRNILCESVDINKFLTQFLKCHYFVCI